MTPAQLAKIGTNTSEDDIAKIVLLGAALSHPLRIEIMKATKLTEMSPVEVAATITGRGRLGSISYHFRWLADNGLIKMTRIEPRRGALKHFYRLNQEFIEELAEATRSCLDEGLVKLLASDLNNDKPTTGRS
ncbi:MAG TPA: hypothetical protein VNA68_01300 [Candidatus Dormibacteraeota bacterium]|nr:hypothetical protein [Candidatus Dormibacteraeota bacterium]